MHTAVWRFFVSNFHSHYTVSLDDLTLPPNWKLNKLQFSAAAKKNDFFSLLQDALSKRWKKELQFRVLYAPKTHLHRCWYTDDLYRSSSSEMWWNILAINRSVDRFLKETKQTWFLLFPRVYWELKGTEEEAERRRKKKQYIEFIAGYNSSLRYTIQNVENGLKRQSSFCFTSITKERKKKEKKLKDFLFAPFERKTFCNFWCAILFYQSFNWDEGKIKDID